MLITSDKDDLKYFKNEIKCIYINNFYILNYFFKILNCKFMIMTLADLGNHLQKSKLCKYYVYYFHAIGSTHQLYKNQAFKNFDIVLANGEYQSKELKLTEIKSGFPNKEIINSGYIFLDNLYEDEDLDKTWFTNDKINTLKKLHDYLKSKKEIGKIQSIYSLIEMGNLINKENLSIFELSILYNELPEIYKTQLADPYLSVEENMVKISSRIRDSK